MKKILLFFVSLLLLFGCGEGFKSLSSADFEKMLQEDLSVQLVDVRHQTEFDAGHIDNAVLIDVKDTVSFLPNALSVLDKSRPVAVYCKAGHRSRVAAKQLIKEGFTVINLDKGYDDWVKYQSGKR